MSSAPKRQRKSDAAPAAPQPAKAHRREEAPKSNSSAATAAPAKRTVTNMPAPAALALSTAQKEEQLLGQLGAVVLGSLQRAAQATACHGSERKKLLALLAAGPLAAAKGDSDKKPNTEEEDRDDDDNGEDDDDNATQTDKKRGDANKGAGGRRGGAKKSEYDSIEPITLRAAVIDAIREVVLNRLAVPTAADTMKRYTAFVVDICKHSRNLAKPAVAMLTAVGRHADDLSVALVEALIQYHNARDKGLRLAVCTLVAALLPTISADVERDDLYNNLAACLKFRAFDKDPLVRERAIAALRAFHEGSKDDDVTQCALSLMCEDTVAKVREAALMSANQFRSVHLHHIMRMMQDVNASVRRACWEAMSKFNLRQQLMSYVTQLRVDLFALCAQGLSDPAETVKDACRSTLGIVWLHHSFNDDVLGLLKAFFSIPCDASPEHACAVTQYLLTSLKDKWTPTPLDAQHISRAHITLWKCSVLRALDMDNLQTVAAANRAAFTHEDDINGLPTLGKFNAVLTAVTYHYVRKPIPAPKGTGGADSMAASASGRASTSVVPLAGTATTRAMIQACDVVVDEEMTEERREACFIFIIDTLLSMFDVYADLSLLGHADDTGRAGLIRPLGYLLKVVTMAAPTCFVDAAVKAIRAITERHPGEGKQATEAVLKLLFASLTIPKQHGLSYEDTEAYARVDTTRRRRIAALERERLETGEELTPESEEGELVMATENDDAFLRRMCRIAHAQLSCSSRGVEVPSFVAHMIQLGRAQCDVGTTALATQCLGLQCLIDPQTVATFLPLLLREATSSPSTEVAVAATGVLVDIYSEYGGTMFDVTGPSQPPSQQQTTAVDPSQPPPSPGRLLKGVSDEADGGAGARRQELIKMAGADDAFKPGSHVITRHLLRLMSAETTEVRHIATFGLAKLLAANKLLPEAVPLAIARLFLFLVSTDATAEKHRPTALAQLHALVESFFGCFAYSHPKRQAQVLEGGVLGLRLILAAAADRSAGPTTAVPKIFTKALRRLMLLCDAIHLQQVRDVDPDLTARYAQQNAAEVSRLSGGAESLASSSSAKQNNSHNTSGGSRSATMRLWRELGKHSLHERLALDLLAEAALYRDDDVVVKALLQDLQLLRLYRRDPIVYEIIAQGVRDCGEQLRSGASLHAEDHQAVLDAFLEASSKVNQAPLADDSFNTTLNSSHPQALGRLSGSALVQAVGHGFEGIAARLEHRREVFGPCCSVFFSTPNTHNDDQAPFASPGSLREQTAVLFTDSPDTEASLSSATTGGTSSTAAPRTTASSVRTSQVASSQRSTAGSTGSGSTAANTTSDPSLDALLKGVIKKKKR